MHARKKQRAWATPIVEQAVNKIWHHCRDNRNSLDSERQCKAIARVVNLLTAVLRGAAEEHAAEAEKAQGELTKVSRALRRSEKKQRKLEAIVKKDVNIAHTAANEWMRRSKKRKAK